LLDSNINNENASFEKLTILISQYKNVRKLTKKNFLNESNK